MASGIAVTPERLREISAKMNTGAADVKAILSKLAGDVAPVRSEWAGAAQTQFNALWDQLQQDATGLQSVLTGIAKLTESAATAYEAAEQSIAQSFNEFRSDKDAVEKSHPERNLVRATTVGPSERSGSNGKASG
jgi:WXG100 family type VII secretion target